MSQDTPLCVYCGIEPGITMDQAVPRCIFGRVPPPDLITVPACLECNCEAKSRDDTFFRDFLVSDIAGNTHETANELFAGKVTRAIARNQSELGRLVRQSTPRRVDLQTPAGIFLGHAYRVDLPPGRIASIVFRIMRGLYYSSRKVVFPAATPYEVRQHPGSEWQPLFKGVFGEHRQPPMRVFGTEFACAYTHATEDPFTTIWLIGFYERIVFSVLTGQGIDPEANFNDA